MNPDLKDKKITIQSVCEMYTPTADVVEVKHSEWTEGNKMCKNCGEGNPTLYMDEEEVEFKALYLEYCPHCGAKMDGGKI